MRKALTLFLALTLVAGVAFAGAGAEKAKKMRVDDGITQSAPVKGGTVVSPNDNPVINWVLVDSMANAFGPANSQVKPLWYDPATNAIVLIHRGKTPYALGSGQLWYNMSRNNGTSFRRVSELNVGIPATELRYPSIAIANATNSADTSNALMVYAAPRLINGAFGGSAYGVDAPLGGAAPFAVADAADTLLTSNLAIWTAPGNAQIYWATNDDANFRVWRTTDYVTVNSEIPAGWRDGQPNFENALGYIYGTANSTGSYFAVQGLFAGDTAAFAYNGGYSKSTNNGTSWGSWVRPRPDWMLATGLPTRWDLQDYEQPPGGTVDYNSQFIVDANGRGHFMHVVVDTPWTLTDTRGILEVYETGTGWAYKWITQNLNENTKLIYGTLDQTNNSPQASISPDGQVMTMVWVDGAGSTPADTLPDVWFSYRRINAAAWSTPVNLTTTPLLAELILHAAPILKSNGSNSYTLFLSRTYQTGNPPYPPGDASASDIFVGSHTFTAPATGVDEGDVPGTFALEQNYPNPFNPSTTLSFTIPARSEVSLKVYDILGQEVSTLVNEFREAGSYQVNFNAKNLASGMYYYTIRAGEFTATKKMMLVK